MVEKLSDGTVCVFFYLVVLLKKKKNSFVQTAATTCETEQYNGSAHTLVPAILDYILKNDVPPWPPLIRLICFDTFINNYVIGKRSAQEYSDTTCC